MGYFANAFGMNILTGENIILYEFTYAINMGMSTF